MKVKLLKKIRKRFEITYYPNGYTDSCGRRDNRKSFKLVDYKNEYNVQRMYLNSLTELECIYALKLEIISILRAEGYRGRKDKKAKDTQRKVWYITNKIKL